MEENLNLSFLMTQYWHMDILVSLMSWLMLEWISNKQIAFRIAVSAANCFFEYAIEKLRESSKTEKHSKHEFSEVTSR